MKSINRNFYKSQSGFTVIEIMIIIAIIGILASIATVSYQTYIRKTKVTAVYQELSHYRLSYETLAAQGVAGSNFSIDRLNMPLQSKYCQFSVTGPTNGTATAKALSCEIQNLNYLSNQTLSLDRAVNGAWSCRASTGIFRGYLPQACQ